jgi:4-amino-4-deoxy-L-arabinose transferase-like glycosyltransferase
MSFDTRLSPSRVSAAAASQLPRWALFGLLVAYIAFGLFGRDPWYSEDASGLGIMATMAHGGASDWWLPNIAGEWMTEEGPLPFWLGALFIRLLGPLIGDAQAARLTCVPWFALGTTALWYATYRLARRREAQPVSFAFGGEAEPRDYGRMLADIAVLLLLGTIGIVLRMHETTAETAAIAWVGVALFALVLALDAPLRGALLAGLAIGALALSRGLGPAAWLLLAAVSLLWFTVDRHRRGSAIVVAVAATVVVTALWPIGSFAAAETARSEYWSAWRATLDESITLPRMADLAWIPRNLAWYTWPLWPLAAWTAYSWRHALRLPHIALPGVALIAMTGALLTWRPVSDSALMMMVPPLVLLAAFGATSLRRSLDNLIDWFAIATFSLFALAAWLYFIALSSGAPPRMAASVMRLVPGFEPTLRPLALVLAIAATIGWLALVAWRIGRRPPMLWRGPVLAASGLTMLWLLVVTLFLPAVNYNRSYAPIAAQLRAQVARLAPGSCVIGLNLFAGHKALLAHHGGLRFAAPGAGADCDLLLQRDSRRTHLDDAPPAGEWTPVWEGRWPARADETLRLYRRGL